MASPHPSPSHRSENSLGSFTLPTAFASGGSASSAQASLEIEDSLQLDVQLLPPVVPEEIPADEAGEAAVAAAERRQWERRRVREAEHQRQLQQSASAAAIAAGERAFHAKVAGWEDELLGMLQTQVGPRRCCDKTTSHAGLHLLRGHWATHGSIPTCCT
jgi:hypothetical protein